MDDDGDRRNHFEHLTSFRRQRQQGPSRKRMRIHKWGCDVSNPQRWRRVIDQVTVIPSEPLPFQCQIEARSEYAKELLDKYTIEY